MLLGGCATPGLVGGRATLAGLPTRVEHDDAPFHPQLDYQCGPAALATALGHAGLPGDPVELARQVFLPARQGSLQLEMLAGARRQGGVATRVPDRVDALLREVAAGQVVVVLQNLALSFAPRWHYAVVVGYDLEAGEVVLRSGTTRRERLTLRTFAHTWQRAGFWGFVVLPPGRWPATVTREAAIEAAVGFERAVTAAQAEVAYRTGLERWPDDLTLAMGLGNTIAAQSRWAEAAEVFRAAAERHGAAPAWINLSTVLVRLGEPDAALEAARNAQVASKTPTGGAWRDAAESAVETARRAERAQADRRTAP
jgi:hypothetical protein